MPLVDTRLINSSERQKKKQSERSVSDIAIDRSFPITDYSFFLIRFLTTGGMNTEFVLNMGLFCSDLRFKAF